MPVERLTRPTRQVLEAFLEQPAAELYGLDLMRRSGLPSGTLYQILARLEQTGWVERRWEDPEVHETAGRPRRRYYRLTADGAALARQALSDRRVRAVPRLQPGTQATFG